MTVSLFMLLLCPVAAALLVLLFRSSSEHTTSRWIALIGAVLTLLLSLVVAADFQAADDSARFAPISGERLTPVNPVTLVRQTWMSFGQESGKVVNLEFFLGVDGISVAMILLTTVLTISAVLISWESIKDRASEFYACLLFLEAGLIGVFCSFDLLMFYVFFEFTLLPLFFMVGIWGGPQRRYAAVKFFLYTLVGGLITLLGIVCLVSSIATTPGVDIGASAFSIPDLARYLTRYPLSDSTQFWLFLALAAGFMVKVPLFPFHTWLPLAHVEAPTAGSVMLAGVLLKLGTYGFLRLCLPIVPAACLDVGLPLIGTMSVIGIVYGSLCALAQRDIKKLVAYSSVAHLGFCMLGIFALNAEGIAGGVLQMINHGLSTGGLFLIVGMIYERYHTRQLDDLGGLANRLPLMACAMVFISMSSIGLPMLNGFVGEALSLIGMFKASPVYAVIGASGVVLGAWYLLTMLQHGFFGPLREPKHGHGEHHEPITDMTPREFIALAPLLALCLWIGITPQPTLDLMRPDIESLAKLYENGPPRAKAPSDHPGIPKVETAQVGSATIGDDR